jgi:hypothetical protein
MTLDRRTFFGAVAAAMLGPQTVGLAAPVACGYRIILPSDVKLIVKKPRSRFRGVYLVNRGK